MYEFVIFLHTVAARVVGKPNHIIKKHPVSVSFYEPLLPPKSADDMLLLKNIPRDFKVENLELYLDMVTDLEYEDDDYAYDIKKYEGETLILVTFYNDIGKYSTDNNVVI